ncbi:hypothetical protein R80B4_00155 [Fibrobacteres bacterium R8-0-B4]
MGAERPPSVLKRLKQRQKSGFTHLSARLPAAPRRLWLLPALFCCAVAAAAQTTVSINDCYSKAQANYPLIRQYGLIDKARDYNLSNAGKGYLPQVAFSAKATWQSDVTKLDIDIPQWIPINLPDGMKKDQYGATVDVSQLLWDGGTIKSRRESIRAAAEAEKKSLKADLYAINERVNQIYFGVLLFDAQLEQNKLFREELLGSNYDRVSSCVQNGTALKADLDAVKAEQLKAMQTESQLTHQKSAYLEMLSALIGEKLGGDVKLVKPETISFSDITVERPELEMFDAMIKSLQARNEELSADRMPKLSVFATGGYGRPGLNMLDSDFSWYFLTGARLSWNFGSLYTNKNSKQLIQNNINSVMARRDAFLFNVHIDVSGKRRDIDKYGELIKYDDDIIVLRKSVRESSEAKIANGTLSGVDLMRDVFAEESAKQAKIVHEIEWLLAMYNLKFVTNGK